MDQLLRWHFRQAVLANMKGAGAPMFEHDFAQGVGMVGEMWRGPKAAGKNGVRFAQSLSNSTT